MEGGGLSVSWGGGWFVGVLEIEEMVDADEWLRPGGCLLTFLPPSSPFIFFCFRPSYERDAIRAASLCSRLPDMPELRRLSEMSSWEGVRRLDNGFFNPSPALPNPFSSLCLCMECSCLRDAICLYMGITWQQDEGMM